MQKTAVRSSAVLTTSYVVGNKVTADGNVNQLVLSVNFTKGSLTSGEIKVELSYDDTDYLREQNASVSSGTSTLSDNEYTFTTTGKKQILIPLAGAAYIKVYAKGTGTVTDSLMAIDAYTVKV
nr:MAG: hypothetical protein [Podoviridae sp. ctka020]